MNELPSSWAEARLETLTDADAPIIYGILQPGPDTPEGVPYVRPTEVVDDHIQIDGLRRTTQEIAQQYQRSALKVDDVLLSIVGTIGKVAVVPSALAGGNITQSSCRIRADKQLLDPVFLAQQLRSSRLRQQYEEALLGTGVPRLNIAHVRSLQAVLPPLPEQHRIVAKLGTLQVHTRLARAELATIPALLDHYRQSILAAAFRGDLSDGVSDQSPPKPPSHNYTKIAKLQQGYNAPSEVPEKPFPSRWPVWLVAEAVDPDAEIVYGIVQPGPEHHGGIPYVRGMDIQDGRIAVAQLRRTSPEIAARYERAALRGGDVLLGIIRATKVAVVPDELEGANITQGTARFRPSGAIRTDYLAHYLASPFAQSWLHAHYRGINMPGLNLADVRMLPIPVPSLREQEKLAQRISNALRWIESVEVLVSRLIVAGDNLDKSLLAAAFRGELVPQDPNDEPASVLLDRIHVARAEADQVPRARRPRAPTTARAVTRAAEPAVAYRTADPYAAVRTALRKRGTLANSDAQEATGLDAAGVRPLLQRLVAEGHARIEGQKRGTRYVSAKNG